MAGRYNVQYVFGLQDYAEDYAVLDSCKHLDQTCRDWGRKKNTVSSECYLPRYNPILPAPTLDPPASLPYPTPYNHILPRPTLDPPAILPCPTQSYLADYQPTQSYLIQPHPTLDLSTILPCPTLFLPHITLCTPHPAMEFITHPTPTTHPGDSFKTIHLRKRKTCDVFEHPG